MLKLLLRTFGWLVAHVPEPALHALAIVLGEVIFRGLRERRRLILSNLDHAFPEKSSEWRHAIGRQTCRRLIETGLLSLATPFLSERRLRQIISASPDLLAAYERQRADPAPTLICTCHIAYWESQTSMPLVVPGSFPEFGTIFRPLDNAAANEWIRRSRERFGMRLLSRKEGFAEALKILRRKGFVGLLFDQNAGMQGALTTLFGRVCSTTELPALMAEKFGARVYGIFPRRLGFWRLEIDLAAIPSTGGDSVTLGLNRWLELLLTENEDLCASWLWAHDRWRHQDMPHARFRLESKRNLLDADLAFRGLNALPRRTRIWVRLPNWLGDEVMTLPLLRALRKSRPDAEITLIARAAFGPLIRAWGVADQVRSLPAPGGNYFATIRQWAADYPDVYLLFTNSIRGDFEAWLTGCPQRFGLVRRGHPRPLLTHAWKVPTEFDFTRHHQVALWEKFLRHFGLSCPLDFAPLALTAVDPGRLPAGWPSGARRPIGLIPGSENSPEKRWPTDHWRSLIGSLPEENFVLFGTPGDRTITSQIAAQFSPGKVLDLAGRTDLLEFAACLRQCALLVTNDSGGMHLVNASGVPLVALFGPTNPIRTGPVFTPPVKILQPPGCASTGGGDLTQLSPEMVLAEISRQLSSNAKSNPASAS